MAEGERPSAEEIILYGKDAKTEIGTITFSRPEFLHAPTTAARLRFSPHFRLSKSGRAKKE